METVFLILGSMFKAAACFFGTFAILEAIDYFLDDDDDYDITT
jgi:hypothetical protein